MAQLYLYSTSSGSFVFNQNFFMIDKVLFSDKEIIENSMPLAEGKFIEAEKKLIKKHKKGQFVIIGIKKEELSGIKSDPDIKKLARIAETARKEGLFESIRHANIIITRHRVSHSVNEDIFVSQAVNHLGEMERITNTMAKRLREWYSYYLPEFSESIQDHEKFAEIVAKKTKEQLLKELRLGKEDSMGADIKKKDIDPMMDLARELSSMYRLKKRQADYIEKLMKGYCPNISAVAGPVIGAKLLEQAGSLKRLAEFPSSTVQVLGAEEAFFRHLTQHTRPPKHGYIHEHPFIAQAGKDDKGRIARALADKISIAAKVDYFKGKFVGDKLRKMVEAKLKQGKAK